MPKNHDKHNIVTKKWIDTKSMKGYLHVGFTSWKSWFKGFNLPSWLWFP